MPKNLLTQQFDRFLPAAARDDAELRLRSRILVSFAFGIAAVIAVGWVLRIAIGTLPPRIQIVSSACLIFLFLGPILLRRGLVKTASFLVVLSILVMTFASTWMSGGLQSPILVTAPLLPILATVLIDLRWGLRMAGLVGVLVMILLLAPHHGWSMPLLLDASGEIKSRALLTMISCLMGIVMATFYDRQQRTSEREKAASEERYRKIFERSKDIVILLQPDGALVDINPAGVEFFGFSSKERVLSEGGVELFNDPQALRDLVEELDSKRFAKDFESRQVSHDGSERVLRGTTAVTRERNGHIEEFLAVLRDVSEEEAVAKGKEEALSRLATQNDELERFAYTISHDLKSPLVTIKGFLGLLRKDMTAGSEARVDKDISTIANAADQMQRLLDDLLEYSRVGHNPKGQEELCVGDLVQEVLHLLSGRIASKGVKIRLQDDLPTVYGHPALLRMVFLNLLDNGIKFTRGEVEIGARETEDGPLMWIADDGPGIPEDAHDRAFGLFEKLDPESEGTGIGLATVKRAIEIHQGRIWIESTPGAGATFFFTIPSRSADAPPS